MKLKIIMTAIIAIILNSCVSGSLVYINEPISGPNRDKFVGKSIGVEPFEIEFSARRFAIDLRGLKMSVNGQEIVLQKKYITKAEDDRLGRIGILEVNALEKTGSDKQIIQENVTKEWISGLLGKTNYNIGYFNGFGEGNSGFLTNVPVERNPVTMVNFLPAEKETTYFTEVRDLTNNDSEGLDYILRGYIDLSNEVAELIEPKVDDYGSPLMNSMGDSEFQEGQYYLLINAMIEWEIVDVKTGEIVVNNKAKSNYLIDKRNSTSVLLPVNNGDSEAFSNYFRNNDLTQFALEEILGMMPRNYHHMAPYYSATSRFIADEK